MEEKKQSKRWVQEWARTALDVRQQLDLLAPEGKDGLPMEFRDGHAATGKLGLDEWMESQERQRRHQERETKYHEGWRRPSEKTAEAVWDLLAPRLGTAALFPPFPRWQDLSDNQRRERTLTVKQALVVALDCVVSAGRYAKRLTRQHEEERLQQRLTHLLTFNSLFDTLASRWSPNYRLAQEDGRAYQVRDMKVTTAQACRRDLVRAGINLDAFWDVAVKVPWPKDRGGNPLYWVRQLKPTKKQKKRGGYVVDLKGSPELDAFEQIIRGASSYRRVEDVWRLWIDDADQQPPQPPARRQEICAERPYNVVRVHEESERVLRIQAGARLLFNTKAFSEDYEQARESLLAVSAKLKKHPYSKTKDKKKWAPQQLRLDHRRTRAFVAEFYSVYEQARALGTRTDVYSIRGYVPVRSHFYRTINRRYQHAQFWPPEASTKLDQTRTLVEAKQGNRPVVVERTSARERWFAAAAAFDPLDGAQGLVGYDVSSSQTQILALFLGLDELERLACSREEPFKQYLAKRAWEMRARVLNDGYTDDYTGHEKLIELVKSLWMRRLYGSEVYRVVNDQHQDEDTFGPGWKSAKAAARFLDFAAYRDVEKFLKASRRLAEIAYKKDPHAGVVLEDPFDHAAVVWNPVERVDKHLGSGDHNLIVSVPAGKPNKKGDYPVDLGDLTNMVAPCLVHMLDGYFSSLVIEELHKRGVRDFVAIHDCWLLSSYVETEDGRLLRAGPEMLEEAMMAAAPVWFAGLGPIYTKLLHYLGDDPDYGELIREAQKRWRNRKLPIRFSVKPSKTFQVAHLPGAR